MSQAVKRACDACHRRKVKCDGINPCRNCTSAQLSCTYNAIPQKKGPKGSRAKVISELRETQRQTSLYAKVQNRMNGIACPPSMSLSPTPGLLTTEMVKECINFFFENLYTQLPILERRTVEQHLLYMEQNKDAYCLMTSLCAFVLLQPGMALPPGDPYNLDMVPGANIISSQLLVEETIRVRKGYEYLDSVTLNALATNFFLFGCFYGQEMHDKAWYQLREATTMIHIIGMNKEDHLAQFDVAESARRRRLFWLYHALERAYAIQRQRPLSLHATVNRPTLGDDPTDPLAHQLNSYLLLTDMYRPFDDACTANWNKTKSHLSAQYIKGLQKQLNELAQSFACQDSSFHDVGANQSWLKNTVWQLTNGVVNPGGEEGVSFQYPMDMSRELLMNLASQFPGQGVELMNSGLIEKLLEITYSMMEYLSLQPASRDPFAIGPEEHLNQIMSIVSMARHGDYRFMPLLLNKVNETLPRLANPMLQNPPENPALANIDIFDGFGNAGMAQPAPQMQLQLEPDYDRKFNMEAYDKKYALDMANSSGSESGSHVHSNPSPPMHHPQQQQSSQQDSLASNSSFGATPSITSPTGEYPTQMTPFACTPLNEMVMSPLGNPSSQQNPMNAAAHMAHQSQPHHQQQQSLPPPPPSSQPQHQTSMMHQGNMPNPHMSIPSHHQMTHNFVRQTPQRQGSYHIQNNHPTQQQHQHTFQTHLGTDLGAYSHTAVIR